MLTFFNAINYGTFLQAFALQQVLLELGYDVEVINYNEMSASARSNIRNAAFGYLLNPRQFFSKWIKKKRFDEAHKMLKLTKPMTKKDIQIHHFEHILIGSDEVWKLSHPAIEDISLFFGRGLSAKIISSYAASVGSDADFTHAAFNIRELLTHFNHLSVRDESTQRMILKMLGKNVPIHLDPTFLYEFEREVVNTKYKKYILVYGMTISDTNFIKEIKSYAQKNYKKLIAVGPLQPWCDINVYDAGPFEFLGLLKNADAVVTTLHHGTIFSIHYNKPFCILMNTKIQNKVTSILTWLGLRNVYQYSGDFDTIIDQTIDWNIINKKIREAREKSLHYLLSIKESR